VFVIDAFLFLHLCVMEMRSGQPQPNISAVPGTGRGVQFASRTVCRPATAYLAANICNVLASIGYLTFNAYALYLRYQIESTEPSALIALGQEPADWYFVHLRAVTRQQRAMFFAADLLYLGCALLLEWAWYHEEVETEEEMIGGGRGGALQQQRGSGVQQHVKMIAEGVQSDEYGNSKAIELSQSGLRGDVDTDMSVKRV